jgi:ATP-dependent RNA helicase DeaD
LTTEDRVTLEEAKAALERGRPVILVRPPAAGRAAELWPLVADVPPAEGTGESGGAGGAGAAARILIVCPDELSAVEWAAAAPAGLRTRAVTGLARAARLLRERGVDVLAGAPEDLLALAGRAVLKLEQVAAVVLAWPEALLATEHAAALDVLLGEARAARRVVLSWNPALLADFLERHARRALVVGAPPVNADGAPLPPVGRVRAVVAPREGRAALVRDALDALAPRAPYVWSGGPVEPPPEPPDAVVALELPTREELAALVALGEPIVFVTGAQLPYLRSIATVAPFALPTRADRAHDRAEALRERVARRLAAGPVDAELLLLDPLFARFDPAEVAAALAALLGEAERGASAVPAAAAPAPGTDTGRVKLFVSVGKKDRAAAKDLVGALIREAGVPKTAIGRIEVRDTFSLVEVASPLAEQAARGLSGTTIRGRRVLARLDRRR